MNLNYRNMKRIIYSAAIAALLVTSCQKTDVLNVADDTIDFNTEVGKLTKADDYTLTKYKTLVGQGFRVWVLSDFDGDVKYPNGQIYDQMDNLPVTYDKESSKWGITSDRSYYWPQPEQYLQFYTISSNNNNNWLDEIGYPANFTIPVGGEVTGLDLPEYSVNDSANDDIMVANHIRQQKDANKGGSKTVSPTFRHTMTKVEFNFKKGTPGTNAAPVASTVILTKIKTSHLSSKGSLDVTYGTDNASMAFTWTPKEKATNDGESITKQFTYIPSNDVLLASGGRVIAVYASDTELDEVNPSKNDLCVVDGEFKEYNGAEWVDVTVATKKDGNWTIGDQTVTSYETIESRDAATPIEENALCVVDNKFYKYQTVDGTSAWVDAAIITYETIKGEVLSATDDFTNYVTWYMIPQDLEDTQTVEITYIADGKVIPQLFKLTVDETLDKDWNEETCVRYNVTIAPHKVIFNPIVKDWDTDFDNDEDDDYVDMEN